MARCKSPSLAESDFRDPCGFWREDGFRIDSFGYGAFFGFSLDFFLRSLNASAFLPRRKGLTGSRQLLELLAIFQELADFAELASFHVAVRGMTMMPGVFDEDRIDE